MNRSELKGFLSQLETGALRVASRDERGGWHVDASVKEGILAVFRGAQNKEIPGWPGFVDKDLLTPRLFSEEEGIRLVPGGSSVRPGVYLGEKVSIMPPSYVNIGAYVGEGTMIDSHVLVGSCAQIGSRVHVSVGARIAGVLEPVSSSPVIIEDDVFVGAGVSILEGLCVRTGAVLAPGVTLSKSVEVIDLVAEKVLPRGSDIPENAVVIPGNKPVASDWARAQGLTKQCALIVKYRDEKTSAVLELESALR